jgi:hypothetical protein
MLMFRAEKAFGTRTQEWLFATTDLRIQLVTP